jgi:hypothetical protein
MTGNVICWYEFETEPEESIEEIGEQIRAIHGNVEIAYFKDFARVTVKQERAKK